MSMQVRSSRRGTAVTVTHFLSNVLLGISLGLLSYYAVTSLVAGFGQATLQDSLATLGPIAEAAPPTQPVDDPWANWDQEDRAYWEALELGGVFGRLAIEDVDLDVVVVKGTGREQLKAGPGWIVETDMPGPTGNCGIAGHRTTYGAPFRHIDDLGEGDVIQFYSPFRKYSYRVIETLVVRPDQTRVIASTEDPTLTLTACHPPYSAAYRIVVQARLVEVERLADAGLGEGG